MQFSCNLGVYILLVGFFHYGHLEKNIDGPKLTAIVKDILDSGLIVADFQKYLNTVPNYTISDTNGRGLRDETLNSVIRLLKIQVDAVHRLAAVASQMYSSQTDDPLEYPECCKVQLNASNFAETLNSAVDQTRMCYTRPSPTKVTYPFNDSAAQNLQNAFVTNRNSMSLLDFGYFASENGILFVYPAYSALDCYNLDSRTQPWYGQTYNKYPRDLVIIIDMSTNLNIAMFDNGVSIMNKTRNSVEMIVNAVSSKDRIAIVPIGTGVTVDDRDNCFTTQLTAATDLVKTSAKSYLAKLQPSQAGEYGKAIGKAFQILQDRNQANRSSAVIFIVGSSSADVLNDRQNVFNDVLQYSWPGPKPIFISYILGNNSAVNIDVEATIALYPYSLQTTILAKSTDVGKIALFYSNLPMVSVDDSASVCFTPPFVDFTNKGYVTVITQPVFSQAAFIGVVGVHVSLSMILDPIISYKMRGISYPFLFDLDNNNTFIHPLIPLPKEQVGTATLWDISLLEQGLPPQILGNITSGVTGSFVGLLTPRYYPKGTYPKGVVVKNVNSSYHCARMDMESIHWHLCMVLAVEDKNVTRYVQQSLRTRSLRFFYHRVDLGAQAEQVPYFCQDLHRVSVAGITAVKFAPMSFLSPTTYQYKSETTDFVRKLINVVRRSVPNDLLVNAVIDDVWHTTYINDRWTSDILGKQIVPYAVGRYIGTERGMFRRYPINTKFSNYDPTKRPWYKLATITKGQGVLTPPYLHTDVEVGYIVTIAAVVYENNSPLVFGVMGMDITISYIYLRVEIEFLDDCSKSGVVCFLIDSAGYIITHQSWYFTDYTGNINVEDVHITELEPAIAKDMIAKGYLVRDGCSNLLNIRQDTFYQGNVSGTRDERSQAGYMIVEAPNTNVYIVLKQNSLTGDCCHPTGVQSLCQLNDNQCECSCFKPVNFNPCSIEFVVQDWLPCPPPQKQLSYASYAAVTLYLRSIALTSESDLDYCVVRICKNHMNNWDCAQFSSCQWCTHTKTGQLLQKPFCADVVQCWFGQVGHESPYPKSPISAPMKSSLLSPTSVGVIIGAVAAVIAISVIGLGLWQMKVRKLACFKNSNATGNTKSSTSKP